MRKSTSKEIRMGMKVEREHKPTVIFIRKFMKKHGVLPNEKAIYRQIALNHLKEDPKYYIKLKKAKL